MRSLALLPASGLLLALRSAYAQDPRGTLAMAAARDWLALTDGGDAAGSYSTAGARFRNTLTREAWDAALKKERVPRGALVRRTLVRSEFPRKMAGAPEGDYAALLFRTSFANQPASNESVTLEREAAGTWRVVGYVIR